MPPGVRLLAAGACLAAALLISLLATQRIGNEDIGYHLAYGEQLLGSGRIVEANPFLYPLPDYAARSPRPEPGPGCWYEPDGTYHFPNANWLSQAVMALVYRLGGLGGLWWLQFLLVTGTALLLGLAMRALGVPLAGVGAGVFLFALAASERFTLRPELVSYFLLAAEFLLLGRGAASGRPLGARSIAVLALLQVLLVNSHSYFLLGLFLTGGFLLADAQPPGGTARAAAAAPDAAMPPRRLRGFGAALAAQAAASFVSPWPWRLAWLPLETLLFLRRNHIAGMTRETAVHPWARIAEFYSPFSPGGGEATWASTVLVVILVLAVPAAVLTVVRRQPGRLLLLAGGAAVAISMRRNIAAGALLLLPVVGWVLAERVAALSARVRVRATAMLGFLVVAGGAWFSAQVVDNDFFYRQDLRGRFGFGAERVRLRSGVTMWLNSNRPDGRVFTPFNGSSNVHFFTAPRLEVPIVSNTWAYPPELMRDVLDIAAGRAPFEAWRSRYGIGTALASADAGGLGLAVQLGRTPRWAPVFVEGQQIVFVDRAFSERNRALAERSAFGRELFRDPPRLQEYLANVAAVDPVPAAVLYDTAVTLSQGLGWLEESLPVFERVVALDPGHYRAWTALGLQQLRAASAAASPAAAADARSRARLCLEKALSIKPGFPPAGNGLSALGSPGGRR